MPITGTEYSLCVTSLCAETLAKGAQDKRKRPPGLLLSLVPEAEEKFALRGTVPRGRTASGIFSAGHSAYMTLFEAVSQLAFGQAEKAEATRTRTAEQNRQLQDLIEQCAEQVAADPSLSRFPTKLPVGPLELLIDRVHQAAFPRPSAATALVHKASAILAARRAAEAKVAHALAMILEAAKAELLALWGAEKRKHTAPVEVIPVSFFLGHITIDSSLLHLGIAPTSAPAPRQRAIIAETGDFAAAYFNVVVNRRDFIQTFLSVLESREGPDARRIPQDVFNQWYLDEIVKSHEARGEEPLYGDVAVAAREKFQDPIGLRQLIREAKRRLAPASWRKPGPEPKSRKK